MKITAIKTFRVRPRWCFVKIETDEGISGWGEPIIEGKAQTVQKAIEEIAEGLIDQDISGPHLGVSVDYATQIEGSGLVGRNPLQINNLWQKIFRSGFYRDGPILMSALAGIDQALWDIKGKYHNVPVADLLGGRVRDKTRVYTWLIEDLPQSVDEQIEKAKKAGLSLLKTVPTSQYDLISTPKDIDYVVKKVASISEKLNGEMGLALDFHGRIHRASAKTLLKELEPFRLVFVEEPVLPTHLDCLKNIANNTSIPIATGERIFSRYSFKNILEKGWVDLLQPDLSHCGGITEGLKIANMAEAYDVPVAFHCPLGPLTLASSLQLDGVCYNAVAQEQSFGVHDDRAGEALRYVKNKDVFTIKDGYMNIPKGPGLGIEIDEELVKKENDNPHKWSSPMWSYADGSVAEW